MDGNLNDAVSKLQNMLSSEDGKKELENMISAFGGAGGASSAGMGSSNGMGGIGGMLGADSIMKMQTAMEALQRHDDPRSQLLLALKPYLSSARGARIDTAITLLSLGKIPSIMKMIRG